MKFEGDFHAESAGIHASSLAMGQSFHAILQDPMHTLSLGRECK